MNFVKRICTALVVVSLLAACSSSSAGPDADPDRAATSAPTPADTEPTATSAPTATIPEDTEPVSQDSAGTGAGVLDDLLVAFVGEASGGVDVLYVHDGVTTRAAAGVDPTSNDPLEPGRSFRVGSIAKSFVAVMVLQLVDEGRIDLDAPLDTYLPDATVGADVPIRQILSHRSGVPEFTTDDVITEIFADRERRFTPDEILDFVSGMSTGPSGSYSYSNTNYVLLGQLIEAVDGRDINTALGARITEPVGLGNTYFDTGDLPHDRNLVAGWSPGPGGGTTAGADTSIITSAWAAGSLVSNTEDLATFLTALFAGQLTSPESLVAMAETGDGPYGLGIFLMEFSPAEVAYGHGGSFPGYLSYMAVDPETGDVLVILSSNDELVPDDLAAEMFGSPTSAPTDDLIAESLQCLADRGLDVDGIEVDDEGLAELARRFGPEYREDLEACFS